MIRYKNKYPSNIYIAYCIILGPKQKFIVKDERHQAYKLLNPVSSFTSEIKPITGLSIIILFLCVKSGMAVVVFISWP